LKLNRYYNDIDDARLVLRFGGFYNPKMLIVGDEEIMMAPYAINRQALLDSVTPPRLPRFRSYGVEFIQSITFLSNFTHTFAISTGSNYITLFVITELPPEMECYLTRTPDNIRWNILV
jgi:hypothetical protein